ncbi:hypothetical protein PAERUG_P5_London_26_VIM_2_01_09_05806 [Pseudomonas aeruginosa]|nr:hypothetical protein PAERUG_P5_London_26_VIM_2_01_09_05806 [Pseudomonas aeruginosa]
MLLPTAFQPWLLVGGAGRQNRMPWICLGIAWLLALLALLGPSWQQLEQPSMKRSDPLVAILQLTPGMLAGDLSPTRLEQARRKLLDLLRTRNDAQTAIVVYAGSAHTLVPLSDDQLTARNLLDALKPSIMPEPGQRADLAVRQALDLLEQGAQGRGEQQEEPEQGEAHLLPPGRQACAGTASGEAFEFVEEAHLERRLAAVGGRQHQAQQPGQRGEGEDPGPGELKHACESRWRRRRRGRPRPCRRGCSRRGSRLPPGSSSGSGRRPGNGCRGTPARRGR